MKLIKLALRNIRKNKTQHFLSFLIVFFVCMGVLSTLLIQTTNRQTEKQYNQQKYGTWFVSIDANELNAILDTGLEDGRTTRTFWDETIQSFEIPPVSGYLYEQGEYGNQTIGHVDKQIYELFAIHVIEGSDITDDSQILIKEDFARENNLTVGSLLDINVNGNKRCVVAGIFTNNNEFMPSILTNFSTGYATYYSDNSIVGYVVTGDGISIGSYFDVDGGEYNLGYSINGIVQYVEIPYTVNLFGTDKNQLAEEHKLTLNNVILLIESISLSAIILAVLTSTSLKKRSREFSLLRGIGMTTGQLVKVVVFENIVIIFLTVILATGCSLGIMYYYGYKKLSLFGFYDYSFDFNMLLVYCGLFLTAVAFMLVIPIRSSSRQALSGAFDSQKHQYIQVRYRKLKKRTKRRLAHRQVKAYGKISICFIIFLSIIGIYSSIYFYTDDMNQMIKMKKYAELVMEDDSNYFTDELELYDNVNNYEQNKNIFLSMFDENDKPYIIKKKYIEFLDNINGGIDNYICYEINNEFHGNMTLKEGRMPQNPNEIIVSDIYYNEKELYFTDYPELEDKESSNDTFDFNGEKYEVLGELSDEIGNIVLGRTVGFSYQVGDTIRINHGGITYTVVGIIDNEADDIFYWRSGIYMRSDDYITLGNYLSENEKRDYYDYIAYFDSEKTREVEKRLQTEFDLIGYEGYYIINGNESVLDGLASYKIDPMFLILPLVVGIVLCFFLNLNIMLNNIKDYSLLHLIGMTKTDLLKRQLWIVVEMSVIVYVILACYFGLLIKDYGVAFPYLGIGVILLSIFMFFVVVYVVPMFYILNTKLLENYANQE